MKFRWLIKSVLFLLTILCSVIVGIMYTKLSFIDWPYAIGGAILFIIGLIIPVKKKI